MASELIGYIYSIDRRLTYVKKNGETLILDTGSHITSHTDAEIIAAPVPINITYMTGDTALKCMYVPKSYLDKQTHVPVSIFLKEAHAVRELLTARVPGKIFVGTVITTVESSPSASGHEARLFTEDEFVVNFGRRFDMTKDYIGIMNGDSAAANTYLDSVTHFSSSGNIWVGVPGGSDGSPIRLNYLVVLGD